MSNTNITTSLKPPFKIDRKVLLNKLNAVKGKTLGEVDEKNVFEKTIKHPKMTGIAGLVVEASVIGYPADNSQRPDLLVIEKSGAETPTELKTTGVRESGRAKDSSTKREFAAKEPASITAVSIGTIGNEDFEQSNFYHKIENLLFVFYHYKSSKTVKASDYRNFPILHHYFFSFSPEQLKIIKSDWQKIHDFIKIQNGKSKGEAEYPKLSTEINPKLVMLDTAPKHPHPPRIRLKKQVITNIYNESIGKIPKNHSTNFSKYSDVLRKCKELEEAYINLSLAQILQKMDIPFDRTKRYQSKQFAEQVIAKMFNKDAKRLRDIDFFYNTDIIAKTVTVTESKRNKKDKSKELKKTEDLKLLAVNFEELIEKRYPYDTFAEDSFENEMTENESSYFTNIRKKEFEDSDLYKTLCDRQILFMIFKEPAPDKNKSIDISQNKFLGFKFLNLAYKKTSHGLTFIEEARTIWEEARMLILKKKLKDEPIVDENNIQRFSYKKKNPMSAPNFPKSEKHAVFFRGSGKDSDDKHFYIPEISFPMLKQYYWIHGSEIVNALDSEKYLHEKSFEEIVEFY